MSDTQQLAVFSFRDQSVRQGGAPEKPWFVAKDVCDVLGIANSRDAVAGLDDDEKGVAITDTPGGRQSVAVVYESGLYALIFRSRRPPPPAFRKWVTSEVLPSIRRTGAYSASPDPVIASMETTMQALAAIMDLRRAQVAAEAKADEAMRLASAALDTTRNNHGYYSVLGFCRLRGLELPAPVAALHGKRLTAICRRTDREVGTVNDARYGLVNTYPESVLQAYFDALDN